MLDPFCGTGTTLVAALRTGRNSIGIDIDPEYCRLAAERLRTEANALFTNAYVVFERNDVVGMPPKPFDEGKTVGVAQ